MKKNIGEAFFTVLLSIVAFLLIILMLLPLLVAAVAIDGLVFSILWGWFVLPLTHIEMTVPKAMGLVLVIRFLLGSQPYALEIDGKKLFGRWVGLLALVLGMGYIIHISLF